MATIMSSPPPAPALTQDQERQSSQLDNEIASVRAEIAALTKRQSLLSSALLTSTQIQSRLRQYAESDDSFTSLLNAYSIHLQTSAHRLAFGVTSFPFIDPSPDTPNTRLLGLRFDICKRNGEFDAPYYILLRRNEASNGRETEVSNEYRVHRHTIPAMVPLQTYEERYLPVNDEGYGSEDSIMGTSERRQDLQGFVNAIRADLTSWRLRVGAVELANEKLQYHDGEHRTEGEVQLKYGIKSVEPVSMDTYFMRIVWSNGRVGRIKIGDDGTVQKAVVFGTINGGEQRYPEAERALLGSHGGIGNLVDRLKEVYNIT